MLSETLLHTTDSIHSYPQNYCGLSKSKTDKF